MIVRTMSYFFFVFFYERVCCSGLSGGFFNARVSILCWRAQKCTVKDDVFMAKSCTRIIGLLSVSYLAFCDRYLSLSLVMCSRVFCACVPICACLLPEVELRPSAQKCTARATARDGCRTAAQPSRQSERCILGVFFMLIMLVFFSVCVCVCVCVLFFILLRIVILRAERLCRHVLCTEARGALIKIIINIFPSNCAHKYESGFVFKTSVCRSARRTRSSSS